MSTDEYSETFYLFSDSDGEAEDALAALHDLSALAENLATNRLNSGPFGRAISAAISLAPDYVNSTFPIIYV